MNNAKKNKQDERRRAIEEIVRTEFTGQYPLAARQCLHWAECRSDSILVEFLPDLEKVLREEGKVAAAERVAAITQELRESL